MSDASAVVNTVRIDPVTPSELLRFVVAARGHGRPQVVHFIPAHPTVLARMRPAYKELLNAGDLNVPDGMSVIWTLRLMGRQAERLSGPDAMRFVCDRGRVSGLRHYFFGGTPDVLDALRTRLESAYPGLSVVGADSPPFRALSDAEWETAAKRMRASRADVVWVGLGTPKQDVAAEHLRRRGAAPAMLCVGAAFDFLAEAKPRAPAWMRKAGLEWLHRLGTEPSRLWGRYLVGNPAFVAGVVSDYVSARFPRAFRPRG